MMTASEKRRVHLVCGVTNIFCCFEKKSRSNLNCVSFLLKRDNYVRVSIMGPKLYADTTVVLVVVTAAPAAAGEQTQQGRAHM